MNGFLVIDKPAGISSHDVVAAVRKICRMKKVGHTGTLDPFATGVLPVALGEGTKAIPFLDESVKEYRAIMRLGESTATGDCTGEITGRGEWHHLEDAAVVATGARFIGNIAQVPPMYSALKRNGVPLYRLARRGETVEREPRPVTIHELVFDDIRFPDVSFTVRCSRGTYVRTLAVDMGEMLGCGAHLISLRRTVSGPFSLGHALTLDALARCAEQGSVAELVIPPSAVLSQLRDLQLTARGGARVSCGAAPETADITCGDDVIVAPGERVRLSLGSKLVAVAEQLGDLESTDGKNLRIIRVFN
jgi:tRNA pseudouridine55 synthase